MSQDWHPLFALIGEAAAGLFGLLFVVMTLTAGRQRSEVQTGGAYYTGPTALAFGPVLAVSAAALAPELPVPVMALVTAAAGLLGLAYAVRTSIGVGRRWGTPAMTHWSDLPYYGLVPAVLYAGLLAAAGGEAAGQAWAIPAIAFLLLALLLIALRNAWDLVTWLAPRSGGSPPGSGT